MILHIISVEQTHFATCSFDIKLVWVEINFWLPKFFKL